MAWAVLSDLHIISPGATMPACWSTVSIVGVGRSQANDQFRDAFEHGDAGCGLLEALLAGRRDREESAEDGTTCRLQSAYPRRDRTQLRGMC